MGFKENLTKIRKRKKITQIDLANRVGVKQYVVSSWETGRSEPNIKQLCMLAEIFEVPTDYLLDKNVIRAYGEEEFANAVKMLEQDSTDEFVLSVINMCGELGTEKKNKLLDVIKAAIEFNK